MTDMVLLFASLAAFGVLIAGWMMMPDSSRVEAAATSTSQHAPQAT